jgi:hypothetical protein
MSQERESDGNNAHLIPSVNRFPPFPSTLPSLLGCAQASEPASCAGCVWDAQCGVSPLFTAQLGTVQLVRRKIVIMMEYLCVCLLVTVPPTTYKSLHQPLGYLCSMHCTRVTWSSVVLCLFRKATPRVCAALLPTWSLHIVLFPTSHVIVSSPVMAHSTPQHTPPPPPPLPPLCVCPSADVDPTLMAICECRIGMIGQQTVHQTSRST